MSRRFRNRHAKVIADPGAMPSPPVVLDDSNSEVDPTQPDRRRPLPGAVRTRAFVAATAGKDAGDPTPQEPVVQEPAP